MKHYATNNILSINYKKYRIYTKLNLKKICQILNKLNQDKINFEGIIQQQTQYILKFNSIICKYLKK